MDALMSPVLRISQTQFLTNLAAVQKRLAPSELMLVVKDDAYGHGLDWAVGAAVHADNPVTRFGGYDIATSLRIRERLGNNGWIFAWATSDDEEVAAAIRAEIDLGVGDERYLRRIISVAESVRVRARVHLKIDTGLHRNGFRPEEWPAAVGLAARAHQNGHIDVCGVWSHLAEASDSEDDASADAFDAAAGELGTAGIAPHSQHLTASAASWWRPELRRTVSRIGAFCYGIRSADGPQLEGIKPVGTLEAPVIRVENDAVTLGIGAVDGLPSILTGARIATPAGLRPIRRIDDHTTEVDGWPGAAAGNVVRVFGPGDGGEPDATTLAESIGTVGEEILTRLTARVRRVVAD